MKTEGGREGQRRRSFLFLLHPSAFILLFLTGCVHYEYDVVEPPELAGHVGTKAWLALSRGDFEYRMVTSDNRLVVHLYNRGERAAKLLGADSFAVDPRGESHPLQSATIPPGAYVARIFPPPRPELSYTGPTVGVGVGAAYGYGPGHGPWGYGPYHYHDPLRAGAFHSYSPRYYRSTTRTTAVTSTGPTRAPCGSSSPSSARQASASGTTS